MDAVDYRDNLRLSAGRMRWWSGTEKERKEEEKEEEEEEELVEVLLQGKAPWGFTLRGGSEHREPLVITKVEEGSLAAAVCLQAGDEMVRVNAVPLSGSRQEAICLVKSSHKTLTLVVRRAKMVDVVSPHTMPSENEVHVARSFLTRILRSSMRKNDPASRPHSWHSSKLREEESTSPREAPPAPVWQPKHEARPIEAPKDQNPQHPLISQSSMDRLERPSHPYAAGRLSPPKYTEPLCAPGGKRESGFSCFSSGSSPPVQDHVPSTRKGTSTENIFYKGEQTPRYLQLGNGGWEGGRPEDPSRVSAAGRPSVGPVWQVPEKKKSQSPPPPPPPLRSDSFAATKVFPYSEGPGKVPENHQNNKTSEARRSFNPLPTRDLLQPPSADHNHNQLHPNKLFSLSSNDVRHSHYSRLPVHQRQYSDESPFYLHTRTAPPAKTQSVGSYYRSLQDLPTNSRKHARHSTACTETGGHSRYYGKSSTQTTEHKTRQVKTDKPHWISSSDAGFPGSLKTNVKSKFCLPQPQTPYSDTKDRNGHPHLHYSHQVSEEAPQRPETSVDMKRLTRLQDPWVPQEDHRISPLKTPLLHSLAQESRTLVVAERQPAPSTQDGDSMATAGVKVNRRSDRYATTLRKEIQQKRAQLQKSRSAATLTCEDEDPEEWRSMEAATASGVSFSNTYKDHLKEAQARVLQATSFQRRDLEPLGPEAPLLKASNGRVRGRKRFHLAKRTHSFSEPDKIDKVGVEGEPQTGSFGERRKFFEAKPAFSRPVLKSSQGSNASADPDETAKPRDRTNQPPDPYPVNPGHKQVLLDHQRLGTFAEYQATWNKQKKSSAEVKTQGRYHSAENILDTGAEDKTVCVHERSRSSPSADFYTQNMWSDNQTQQSCTRAETRPDLNPQLVPRNQGLVPGLSDHRTKPDSAGSSHVALSSEPKSLLPSPRLHIGPETTSSSQEFQPQSGSDTQHRAPPSSSSSSSPRLSRKPGPDLSKDDMKTEKEEEAPSSSPFSSCRPPPLLLPAAERVRSPSPQFAPLKLTDQPPASSQLRSEHGSGTQTVMDPSSPVRKVPVRIIQSSSEREDRAYLPQTPQTSCVFERPPHVSSLSSSDRPTSSLFSTYTRQAAPDRVPGSVEGSSSGEDAKREELARDIMGKDKSLVDILDQSGRKTTMDLMEGLFPPEKQILEGAQQRRRTSAGSRLPVSSQRSTDRAEDSVSAAAAASLVPSSSYYNTSAPKAELLIKMKDMQEQLEEQDSEDELDVDLASKKKELISSLDRKLEVLREARQSLQEDVEDNEALGREVEATVQRLCQPNQLDKFRMFVGDLDKVVSLLLSLSGRLARVENALNSLEDEAPPEEKRTLTEKRKLLIRQHEDAKELKENLDRRERLVSSIMGDHLDPESLDDYRHFVKMKSALIIEQRKLEDKIKLGEEQLKCLVDSLPLDQRPLF